MKKKKKKYAHAVHGLIACFEQEVLGEPGVTCVRSLRLAQVTRVES